MTILAIFIRIRLVISAIGFVSLWCGTEVSAVNAVSIRILLIGIPRHGQYVELQLDN